ncbi:MAG: SulP family inorganic anion transporter, partial [Deltaproteobacteria bacterium]|nr:SulP family inorganic anion transporter [Deltaproteobacteria bacterium]
MKSLFANAGADFRASVVVFLVAVPLCLGIALGSGAPLAAGIVAGIIGGLVVGSLSASPLSVSGPAAGLTAIVAASIATLGSWQAFLAAVVLAGVLQVAAGALRLGALADFVPNAVIRGLLAAIGLLLILKQAPHLVGFDKNFAGDMAFAQAGGDNTFSALLHALGAFEPAAFAVGAVAMAILWGWEQPFVKRFAALSALPGPLVAVLAAIGVRHALDGLGPLWQLQAEHLVQLPVVTGAGEFLQHLSFPQFSALSDAAVWTV